MNHKHSQHIRDACLTIIQRCDQAEQKAKRRQEAAKRQRDAKLGGARQNHARASHQAGVVLSDVRKICQEADKILNNLKLTSTRASVPALSTTTDLVELTRMLKYQRNLARQTLNELKIVAIDLKAERKKWWKFW